MLRRNKFEFAWTLVAILGLNPNVVVYKLNIKLQAKVVAQKKKKVFTLKRQKAIAKDVKKFKLAKFI